MLPVQLAIPAAVLIGAVIALGSQPIRHSAPHETSVASTSPRPDGQTGMRVLRISIQPGATLPWHRHGVFNAGYLVEGELRIENRDGRATVMKPGDSVSERIDVVRRGSAGPEGATILMFYAS